MVEAYIAGVAAAVLWVCCLYEVARVLADAIEIWREGVSTYVARLWYAEGTRKRAGARPEPPPA
jgi:hypothetical protein